jgi:hypothetical protein
MRLGSNVGVSIGPLFSRPAVNTSLPPTFFKTAARSIVARIGSVRPVKSEIINDIDIPINESF